MRWRVLSTRKKMRDGKWQCNVPVEENIWKTSGVNFWYTNTRYGTCGFAKEMWKKNSLETITGSAKNLLNMSQHSAPILWNIFDDSKPVTL